MRESNIFTPTQINRYIKGFMEQDRLLSAVLVRGELSNYKLYPSGHHYFTLKDAEGALRGVMFRGDAASLRFRPQNGMQVIAAGRITVFPRDGQYQLYCSRLIPEGTGDLYLAFEQQKELLQREGLFDPSHKRPIPAMPARIALVTSPVGAAVRDMLRILRARWPLAEVFVVPVRVQGSGAAEEIAAAIAWLGDNNRVDLIITGRGGGSMEDLWAFNETCVARAIHACKLPVISAVGHEPDVTIADFVADLRASTPSNAAELAVPDQKEVSAALEALGGRLAYSMNTYLSRLRRETERLAQSRAMTDPASYLRDKRMLLDYQSQRLIRGMERSISSGQERLAGLAAGLDAMSPLKVLGRGYAIALRPDGTVLRDAAAAQVGERLALRLAKGSLVCRVEKGENHHAKEEPGI